MDPSLPWADPPQSTEAATVDTVSDHAAPPQAGARYKPVGLLRRRAFHSPYVIPSSSLLFGLIGKNRTEALKHH